jgi:kynurenine formamidase
MKFTTFMTGCALCVAVFLFAQRRPAGDEPRPFTVIDLTHTVSDEAPNWEGAEKSPYSARQLGSFEKHGYFAREITLPEHFATHLDAPAHFSRGRWTVDQIPAERLVRPLVVIDVAPKVRRNADYEVSLEDIGQWEQVNGQIPAGAVVLARTGWDARWNSMKEYRNADANGTPHFPGFAAATARFLIEGRSAVALGIDTMSVDTGRSQDFPVHRYSSARSVYHLENVANLDRAPEAGALIVVAPAKLEGGSGGPVRLLALSQ